MEKSKLLDILANMTVADKVHQLIQLDGSLYSEKAAVIGPKAKLGLSNEAIDNMGSIFNVLGAEELIQIQKDYLDNSATKIPLLFCADIIYGYKTVLPIPLAFGCSWNPALIKSGMSMIAQESAVSGVHAVFSPVADLVRDPRWGRVMESTGEDPYLNSVLVKAQVEGFQGDLEEFKVASCIKHFAAYGAPEAGREYNTVDMSERKLRETYLPAYKSAVDAGCKMVMTSFNTVDGIPVTGNEWLLRDVLRKEWGFEGVIVSDYAATQELIYHGLAENEKEAAKLSITAGVDFDMKTPVYANNLKNLIESNEVDIKLLDEAVLRILHLKNDLGLFENPFRNADAAAEKEILYSDKNRQLARSVAEESIVLLKNKDNVLPLDRKNKIALIGPYADEKSLVGFWAFTADTDSIVTLKDAFEKEYDENLSWSKGCDIVDDPSLLGDFGNMIKDSINEGDSKKEIEAAVRVAQEADTIVVALGEHSLQSGEAASRTKLTLNKTQLQLLDELSKLNKPIVCVLFNGRPLVLDGVLDKVDALVEAWFPGTEGATAITDILFGKVTPSGKLTMSFPVNEGQIPVYYNEFKTGRPIGNSGHTGKFESKYLDVKNEPEFSFGFGLSYTQFEYNDLRLDSTLLTRNGSIQATITVKNTGARAGKETVQLYIQDVFGSVVRPVKELKGFKKISLEPDESTAIDFVITSEDLKFYTKDMTHKAESGKFILYIGSNSQDLQEVVFEYDDE